MEAATDSPMHSARIAKGWTLRKLADVIRATGVPASDSNLSRIEQGKVAPGPALRRAICDALNLDTTQLP